MPSKNLALRLQDRYLMGDLIARQDECPLCTRPAWCLRIITDVDLPPSIALSDTVLKDHTRIGVTCGCYAKFHRQVAHIVDKQLTRT